MPYEKITDLPEPVKHALPKHAQEIFLAVFNSCWGKHNKKAIEEKEVVCHKMAWAAVKRIYEKVNNKWVIK